MDKIFVGRIYKLTSAETNNVYVGSTTQALEKRVREHKKDYTSYIKGTRCYVTSYEIVKYVDATIELIHEGEFVSVKEINAQAGR